MGELPRKTDIAVVGAGPGGYAAAFRAADHGREVTLIEADERLGGTCLHRGCIPSKALLELAEIALRAEEARAAGLGLGDAAVELDGLRAWRDRLVTKLADGLDRLCAQRGVNRVRGRAHFESSEQLRVEGAEGRLAFRRAVVATGSAPVALPQAPFGDPVLDAAAGLAVDAIPERLLVVGGGYVGLEMATIYAALGAEVTVIEQAERLLPLADADLVAPLAKRLESRLAAIHLETELRAIDRDGSALAARLRGRCAPERLGCDAALVAVGRAPASGDLGLENTGVELDAQGCIRVDARQRTGDPHIYAVGDVAGGQMLAHEAMYEGKVAADAIAGEAAAADARAVPAVVYTDPQIAWCGLTEAAAAQTGREVTVARYPWAASGRALTLGAESGHTKLVLEPRSRRVLGMGVVGRGAEGVIAEGVLAVEMGATARDLALTIHAHPTLAETVGEAAERALGAATHWAPGAKRRGSGEDA